MRKVDAPKMPYIEGQYKFGKQRPTAIRLSPSFTESVEGSALGIAGHWSKSEHPAKVGHYVLDEARRFRSVYDKTIVGTKEFNEKGVLKVTICAEPVSQRQFWSLSEHRQVLEQAAELVAALSKVYGIRRRYLNDQELNAWSSFRSTRRGGIVVDEISGWPHDEFLLMVESKLNKK